MSAYNFTRISNKTTAPILDKSGTEVDEQDFVNIPFPHLYPNEKFVLIDWLSDGKRPPVEQIEKPVQGWLGHVAWGSGVKRGRTFGLKFDPSQSSQGYQVAEDGYRQGRALFAQGIYGGLVMRGDFRVLIVQPGTVLPGYGPVEDGSGIALRSFFHAGCQPGVEKIKLGRAKDNYTFAHRLQADAALIEETRPYIQEEIVNSADPVFLLFNRTTGAEQKQRLVRLDEQMVRHPFVANLLARSQADHYTRLATSIPLYGQYRIAVPTTEPTIVWPGHYGAIGASRDPIDSNGSIQSVEIVKSADYEQEAGRISREEVVQYTLSDRDIHFKGCVRLYDEMPFDVEMILCSEDLKMIGGDLKEARRQEEIILHDPVLVFLQWWAAGCAVGVNARWAKRRMGLDHDGDGVKLWEMNNRPVLKAAIEAMTEGETPKLTKTRSDLSTRSRMIRNSMANLIGIATNLSSKTRCVADREKFARQIGFRSAARLDVFCNYMQKIGTDWFKTQVPTQEIREKVAEIYFGLVAGMDRKAGEQENLDYLLKLIATVDAAIANAVGPDVPYIHWPNDYAFTAAAPYAFDRDAVVESMELAPVEMKNAIKPWHDGLVAEICRITLPEIGNILGAPIDVDLLSAFTDWAPPVSQEAYESARDVQLWWNANARRVNFTDPESVGAFHIRLNARIDDWLHAQKIDHMTGAAALWRAAHSVRSTNAGAASVFHAFPAECEAIVAQKPGLKAKAKKVVKVLGCSYQFPAGLKISQAEVEVVEFHDTQSGKLRRAIVSRALLPGQVQSKVASYPRNMIGVVDTLVSQPQVGVYQACIRQATPGSWEFTLAAA